MNELQDTLITFFKQFTPNVFLDADNINDPNMQLFPRITFTYSEGEALNNSLVQFQIWALSNNWNETGNIISKLREAIPPMSSIQLDILGGVVTEYRNPETGIWVEFNPVDFPALIKKWGAGLEWRETEGKSKGTVELWRGNPFDSPRPSDEANITCRYGTIAMRSHLLL